MVAQNHKPATPHLKTFFAKYHLCYNLRGSEILGVRLRVHGCWAEGLGSLCSQKVITYVYTPLATSRTTAYAMKASRSGGFGRYTILTFARCACSPLRLFVIPMLSLDHLRIFVVFQQYSSMLEICERLVAQPQLVLAPRIT